MASKKTVLVSLAVGLLVGVVFNQSVTLIPTEASETPEYLDKLTVLFSIGAGLIGSALSALVHKKLQK